MRLEPHRLVFIDETAVTTKMTRLRGRSPRGTRLEADAPFGHWRTQTFIAGLRINELSAPWVLDGPMNRAAFDIYIETQLAPTLLPGDVVIADNLSSHKSAKAQDILMAQGSWMLFLPPYSPDLNPIEMAYSKLKAHLRRLKARTFDALFQSVAQTCDLFLHTNAETSSRPQDMSQIKWTPLYYTEVFTREFTDGLIFVILTKPKKPINFF